MPNNNDVKILDSLLVFDRDAADDIHGDVLYIWWSHEIILNLDSPYGLK